MPGRAVYAIAALGRILKTMLRADFHFDLPKELIAQRPTEVRSASRLLTLSGRTGAFEDRQFRDFPGLLDSRDLLVFNDTRVIPARGCGVEDSGGRPGLRVRRALTPKSALAHVHARKGLKRWAARTSISHRCAANAWRWPCGGVKRFAPRGLPEAA